METSMEQTKLQQKPFSGDFSIEYKLSDRPAPLHFHSHDVFEIILLLSGGTHCYIADKQYILPKNTVVLLNNMDVHYMAVDKPDKYERYAVNFKPEYAQAISSQETDLLECFFFRPFPAPNILELDDALAGELLALLEKIRACYDSAPGALYGRDLLLRFSFGELLLFINSAYRSYHGLAGRDAVNPSYRQVYPIIDYIHRNMAEKLSLDLLAQKFFMNKFYLCSLFKDVTGITPNQYLINCRIMKAKEYLSRDISVESVCGLVGFNNLSHFSRSFKQHVGVSPKQFALKNSERLPPKNT